MALDERDILVLLTTTVLTIAIYLTNRNRLSRPFPPGPKKLPLLGNLLDLPTKSEWETYARWSKEYNSDIIHISAAGSDIVILNSLNAANELLDKRSAIYSDRPRFTMISELMGWDWVMSVMPYGERWRERRRLFTKYFHPSDDSAHQPTLVAFVHKMLLQLLENPENALGTTKNTIGGMALSLAYGLPIEMKNDPYVEMAEEAIRTASAAAVPGAFLVDIIPALKYIPEWVPGARFQKIAKEYRKKQEDFRNLPFEITLRNIAAGIAETSFSSTCLENLDLKEDVTHHMEVVKDTAGMVFMAGSDTTLSSTHTMLLAMVNYPEIQKKAQEELDRVLHGRLPSPDDQPELPYISAIVKEVLRWQPVTPLGVPHSLIEDDVYKGYHIPKGAIVIGNSWAILHDEEVYPESITFKPERFLKKDGKLDITVLDPSLAAFGFGRRVCAGSHIALSSLFLITASILSTFKIAKAIDEHGVPIEAEIKYKSGLIYHPVPFRCSLEPRSSMAEALIRSAAEYDC